MRHKVCRYRKGMVIDMMELMLRKVCEKDKDLLFKWTNEPTVRCNAFNTEPIPYENHCCWFDRMMSDKDTVNYILCRVEKDGDKEIGQIRFNMYDDVALISYTMDINERGKGYGTRMVTLAIQKIKEEYCNIRCLKAQVKYNNAASAKVFEKCGFQLHRLEEYMEFVKQL